MDQSRSQPRITGGPISSSFPRKAQADATQAITSNLSCEKVWDEKGRSFLENTLKQLASTWANHSMPWVNLHVSRDYNYSFSTLTRPRQLAACSLRGDSKQTERWTRWSCRLELAKALACHRRTPNAGPSHWEWLAEAEGFQISTTELLNLRLGCNVTEWPCSRQLHAAWGLCNSSSCSLRVQVCAPVI